MFRPAPPSVDPIPTRDSLPGYGGGFREARNVGGMTRRFSYARSRLRRRSLDPVPLVNRPVGEKPPGRRPRHNLLPTDDASNSLPSARLFACQGGESQPPLPRDSRPAPLPPLPAHQHPKLRRPVAAIGCAKPPILEPGNTPTSSSRTLTLALLQSRNKRRPTSLSPFAPEIPLSPLPKRREAPLRLGRMHRQSDSSARSCPFPSAALIISFASPASSGPAGALRLRLLPQRPFRIRSASGDRRRLAPPPTAFPPATAIRRTAPPPAASPTIPEMSRVPSPAGRLAHVHRRPESLHMQPIPARRQAHGHGRPAHEHRLWTSGQCIQRPVAVAIPAHSEGVRGFLRPIFDSPATQNPAPSPDRITASTARPARFPPGVRPATPASLGSARSACPAGTGRGLQCRIPAEAQCGARDLPSAVHFRDRSLSIVRRESHTQSGGSDTRRGVSGFGRHVTLQFAAQTRREAEHGISNEKASLRPGRNRQAAPCISGRLTTAQQAISRNQLQGSQAWQRSISTFVPSGSCAARPPCFRRRSPGTAGPTTQACRTCGWSSLGDLWPEPRCGYGCPDVGDQVEFRLKTL